MAFPAEEERQASQARIAAQHAEARAAIEAAGMASLRALWAHQQAPAPLSPASPCRLAFCPPSRAMQQPPRIRLTASSMTERQQHQLLSQKKRPLLSMGLRLRTQSLMPKMRPSLLDQCLLHPMDQHRHTTWNRSQQQHPALARRQARRRPCRARPPA